MSTSPDTPAAPRRLRGVPLVGLVLLAWAVLYLLMMAHGGWRWESVRIWGFGAPADATRAAFGAPRGAPEGWAPYLLAPWLHQSLLGLVLLGWWWLGLGRTLRGLLGAARTWQLVVLGGAAAVAAHGLAHPQAATTAGVGPFDAVLAGVGAQLAWGATHRGARRMLVSGLVSLLVIGLLTWLLAGEALANPDLRPMLGLEAMGAALGAGILLVLAGLVLPLPAVVHRGLAVVLLLALLLAAAGRAGDVLASGDRRAATDFLAQLEQTEYEAWQLSRDQARATGAQRTHLDKRLDLLAAHDYLEGHEGREALLAYVEVLRAWTEPVELPWIPEAAARKAFERWYREHEQPLRKALGLPPRIEVRFYWAER